LDGCPQKLKFFPVFNDKYTDMIPHTREVNILIATLGLAARIEKTTTKLQKRVGSYLTSSLARSDIKTMSTQEMKLATPSKTNLPQSREITARIVDYHNHFYARRAQSGRNSIISIGAGIAISALGTLIISTLLSNPIMLLIGGLIIFTISSGALEYLTSPEEMSPEKIKASFCEIQRSGILQETSFEGITTLEQIVDYLVNNRRKDASLDITFMIISMIIKTEDLLAAMIPLTTSQRTLVTQIISCEDPDLANQLREELKEYLAPKTA